MMLNAVVLPEPLGPIRPVIVCGATAIEQALTAFLGGKGTLWGPAIGALIVVPAQQYLAFRLGASDLYLVSYAAIFLVVILLLPRGIVPSLGEWLRKRRGGAARAVAVPDPAATQPVGVTR